MTVNDWYEQHRKFGALPDQGIATTMSEFKRAAQQQEDQEHEEEELRVGIGGWGCKQQKVPSHGVVYHS